MMLRTIILAFILLCTTVQAQARGLPFIGTGEEMFEVASFPAKIITDYPETATAKVGYKCSHFSILWSDVWTWDCKMVAVTGEDSYADLTAEMTQELAKDPAYAFEHAKRGFWNHYVFWIVAGGFILLVIIGMFLPNATEEETSGIDLTKS